MGDREIRQYLLDSYGITDSIKVQEMDKDKPNEIIVCCLERGRQNAPAVQTDWRDVRGD